MHTTWMKQTNFAIKFDETHTEDSKSGKLTHTSNCPFKTMFGPHPMSVPVPPMLDAYGTQSFNAVLKLANLLLLSTSSLLRGAALSPSPSPFSGCFSTLGVAIELLIYSSKYHLKVLNNPSIECLFTKIIIDIF